MSTMSTFNVDLTVANLSQPARNRRVSAMVDTGATYTTLPEEVVEAIGCPPIGSRQVVFADGREEAWPITCVWATVDGREGSTFCPILLVLDAECLRRRR
jgi:predicted aspartyl protease